MNDWEVGGERERERGVTIDPRVTSIRQRDKPHSIVTDNSATFPLKKSLYFQDVYLTTASHLNPVWELP